jgi:acyl-CoA synthetase (AMP-forming)/AMP-acid ligase II
VGPASGEVLGADTEAARGEGRAAGAGRGWVRTTDLARIDADGFLILGRADQVIIRGGFKACPEDVRAALESIRACVAPRW